MQKMRLDKLGVEVSRLGFGVMRMPVKDDGSIDTARATEMISYAYQNGVNYFDTAYPYHGGQSETFLREALSPYPRDSYFLADKLPVWECKTVDDARAIFREQLEKCGVDYFDFYLLHGLNKKRWDRIKEAGLVEMALELKRQGKIRFLGFSFHDVADVFPEMVDYLDWDFVQIQINYVDQQLLRAGELYDKLAEKNIPCIVMEPVHGGSLAKLPPQAMAPLESCGDPGSKSWPHPAQWALRWCLGFDNMKVVLSGMSDLEQVQQNVELFSDAPPLSEAEVTAVEEARDVLLAAKTIPCTGCGYCQCPQDVYIPWVFDAYNQYQLFQNAFRAKTSYAELTKEHSARACIDCGACVPLCPQNIDIPRQLQLVHDAIASIDIPTQIDVPEI